MVFFVAYHRRAPAHMNHSLIMIAKCKGFCNVSAPLRFYGIPDGVRFSRQSSSAISWSPRECLPYHTRKTAIGFEKEGLTRTSRRSPPGFAGGTKRRYQPAYRFRCHSAHAELRRRITKAVKEADGCHANRHLRFEEPRTCRVHPVGDGRDDHR